MSNRTHSAFPPRKQRGVIMIFVVIAMTSLIAMAGLALDFGVAFLTKSRIQNALDAAALSGAKALKATGSTAQASIDAKAIFTSYYAEQLSAIGGSSPEPIVQFSNSLVPFTPGATANAHFIRVRMPPDFTIPTYLTRVVPSVGDTLALGGSAVAGPVRVTNDEPVCNVTPIVVYASNSDTNCTDGACFGYTIGQTVQLKGGPTASAGNFNLLDLGCSDGKGGSGANCVRDNLAGGYGKCLPLDEPVKTQTGVEKGPFEQGINTRFGQYTANLDSTTFPPDVNVTPGTYSSYKTAVAGGSFTHAPPTGAYNRRVIAVVMSTFVGADSGNTLLPVTGIGCFFLRDEAVGAGPSQGIPAEFTLDCNVGGGSPTNTDLDNLGQFFKIVLYKDPDGNAS